VPMHSRFQTPMWLQNLFCPFFIFAPSSPRHYFFASHCHSLYSTTTYERTNEQTNERTVTPLFMLCSFFAYHY
jgi:hypothetical protein